MVGRHLTRSMRALHACASMKHNVKEEACCNIYTHSAQGEYLSLFFLKKHIFLIVAKTSLRMCLSSSSSAFMLDEWLHVWCSSPGSGRGERWGEPPLARHRAGISIRSVDVATASCRGSYRCTRQLEICGQSHRWRSGASGAAQSRRIGKLSALNELRLQSTFQTTFSCPPRLPVQ